jgi:DNA helicase II / ATP-dependent DNA helicase PcrA
MEAPLDKPTLTPTDEQRHILDLLHSTKSNLLINALAGTGKTSTLELIQNAAVPPVLCLAFNRRIADAMAKRFRSTTTVRTLNGLGHRIWASACSGKLVLDPKKTNDLLRQVISTLSKTEKDEAYEQFWEIISAVGLAKSLGYIPEGKFPTAKRLISEGSFFGHLDEAPSSLTCSLVDEVLFLSIKAAYAGSIDYNDQVYMPALFGGTYPRFPLVLVDEAQDLSPVNHEMLKHLSRSRIIAVGDPFQSIYGFRGAVQSGMSKLKTRFSMTEADLSVSFRCPEAIVRNAQWRAPQMKWNKPGGIVGQLKNPSSSTLVDSSAIICRNNAPLFSLGLRLLGSGRSIHISGSDVGPRIIAILKRLGPELMSKETLYAEIESWRAARLSKQSTTANDIADCMRVFAGFGTNLSEAITYAEHLFKQSGTLHLLTGHKAKGLEWNTVYHLDPWLIGQSDQDQNLRYVIQTRALAEYYEIDSREIRFE